MTSLKVTALSDDLPFGARISGVNRETVTDEAVRNQLRKVFEDRGMIVFQDMESSSEMQFALSDVFGPPQVYALKEIQQVDNRPGVIELSYKGNIADADGKLLEGWVPWHYDACYTAQLNRGAVLRATDIPAEAGLTGFADGIQLYNAVSQDVRAKFKDVRVVYHSKLMFNNQRFGMPKNTRWVSLAQPALNLLKGSETAPRAVHPVIWQRKSGEHVLHVSPWQAAGIFGHEDPEGDRQLEGLCQEIYAKMTPYWHKWQPTEMIIWDNWRFIHTAGGNDPKHSRCMQRTTITGDYGLGCFERDAAGSPQREMAN